MEKATISQLKNRLSEFLKKVRAGQTVVVFDRSQPIARIERGCSELLKTEFRFVVTEVGGCALDFDTDHDYEVARERFAEWREAQAARARALGAGSAD